MTRDDLLTLSQRLREYNHNPHHINPVSDAFHKLIVDAANALSAVAAVWGCLAIPDGWRIERLELDGSVCFIIGAPRMAGVRSNTSVWLSDSDPAHLLLWHLLDAAPPQPAAQGEPFIAQGQQVEADVRCEGCGYMTYHREHMGCVKAARELSALKAQQEPVAWRVTGADGLTVTPEYPKWAEDDSRLLIESLYTAPQPAPAQPAAHDKGEAQQAMRETIRAVFLRNGFTIKEGQTDLKPYVYAAAEELLSIARASWQRTQSAPVSQAERLPLESLEPVKRPVPSGWAVKRSDASRHELYGLYDEYLGPLDGWLQDPRRAVLFGNKEAATAAQAALSVGSKLAISVVWLVYDPVFDTYREQAQ